MGYILILLGFLGFFASIIYIIVKAIKKRFSKRLFFLPLACVILLIVGSIIAPIPEPEVIESIELAVPDYQDEYDIHSQIPIEVSIHPEDIKTDDLKYVTDKDSITFSKSGIVTGSEEGTYNIYVQSGEIRSNVLTITVVDMKALENTEKEAEEQRLAEEKRLAEETAQAQAEAQQKTTEEEAQKQAEAQRKTAEQEAKKQAEAEKENVSSQETTQMYASSTLNIRSSNSTDSKVLGTLSVNDIVEVISTDGDWATVLYNGNIAYASSAYLSSIKIVQEELPTDKVGEQVWIPQSGSKYHRTSGCSGMKNPSQVSKSRAESLGYEPCKKCY